MHVQSDILISLKCTCILKGVDRVSPKLGQKIKDNPKNVRLDLRLTEKEAEDLQYCADKLQTSRTDVINRGVQKIKEEIDKKE